MTKAGLLSLCINMEDHTSMAKEEAFVYHQISECQFRDGLKLLEFLSPQSSNNVLDLGCGTGRLCKVLSERVGNSGKVVGVDPDEERIKIAIAEGKGYNNLQFMVRSDQTFPEDQYDIIISTDVIHWIKDKEATLKRIYDNLKPGGKFGFTTAPRMAIDDLMAEILHLGGPQVFDNVKSMDYFEGEEYYKTLGETVGFEVAHLETEDCLFVFENIKSYIDFTCTVFPGLFDRNHPTFDDLKKRHTGQSITWRYERITAILTKPL